MRHARVRRRVGWLVGCYRREPGWFWIPLVLTIASCVALVNWAAHACRVAG